MSQYPLAHRLVTAPDEAEIFFVGDIHGEMALLDKTLEEIGYRPEVDYIFSVGDLIDRGPDSLAVLGRFLYDRTGRTYAVLGNHDQFMAQAPRDENALYNWMVNGGNWVVSDVSQEQLEIIAQDILDRIPVLMTVVHRGRTYGIVHGGVPMEYADHNMEVLKVPDWGLLASRLQDQLTRPTSISGHYDKWDAVNNYTWDRNVISEYQAKLSGRRYAVDIPAVSGVDFVFHGHTVLRQPTAVANRIYIDTGGVYRGTLTIVKGDDNLSFVTSGNTKGNTDALETVAKLRMKEGLPDPRLTATGQIL